MDKCLQQSSWLCNVNYLLIQLSETTEASSDTITNYQTLLHVTHMLLIT